MIRVNALDHVNIVARNLGETVAFYAGLLDLEPRDPPPPLDPGRVQWMHDGEGRAVFHLSTPGSLLEEAPMDEMPEHSGAVHHVALNCSGHDAMVDRLGERGLAHRLNHVAAIDLKQIFVRDPNGVLLELNYFAGNH